MATDIFKGLKPVAQPSHNAFDKSRRDVFSMKVGMLQPSFVEDVIPEEVLQVNNVNIIRTDSIQSAPFARMSANTEYHFVPYHQIFHDFERLYYERGEQMKNYTDQLLPEVVSSVLPVFDLSDVVDELGFQYFLYRFKAELDSLNESYRNAVSRGEQLSISFFDFTTLQQSTNNITDSTLINAQTVRLWLDSEFIVDVHRRVAVFDMLRILDMLGYGNHLPLYHQAFAYAFENQVPAVVYGGSSFTSFRDFVESIYNTSVAHPAYTPESDIEGGVYPDFHNALQASLNAINGYKPNILRLAAYVKIWSDFYRNAQYDVDTNYSYYFNFDYLTGQMSSEVTTEKVLQMLIPRYRQWKKDLFLGSYPTAQFGSVAVATIENPISIANNTTSSSVSSSSVASLFEQGDNDYLAVRMQSGGNFYPNSKSWNIEGGVSALAIRQAEAMQRYRERILRAGNRVTSLQTAVFGDRSRYLEDNYSAFINGFKQTIDFNSVSTTAEGNGRNVGELASNGVSTYGGNGFTYHSHDFGVIIGLTYILPEAEYEAYGFDPQVTKSVSNDFFKPDFQMLGLSPVFGHNYNMYGTESVLGYLARYWEYKTNVDRVHGEFFNRAPNGSSRVIGAFANYVTPRGVQEINNGLVLNALYVDPRSVDSIFYVASDESQASDQFKVNMNHQVTAVMPMSVTGLPSL